MVFLIIWKVVKFILWLISRPFVGLWKLFKFLFFKEDNVDE